MKDSGCEIRQCQEGSSRCDVRLSFDRHQALVAACEAGNLAEQLHLLDVPAYANVEIIIQ